MGKATAADYERYGPWAVMLNDDLNIDRHKTQRIRPMQVLSLGFSRTGTFSMCEALNTLGYTAYHYSNLFANVQDCDIWQDCLNAKFFGADPEGTFDYKSAFDHVLGFADAITDTPSVLFWRELIAAYPDAQIVLVERDETKWNASIGVLFDGILHPASTYFLRFADPYWFGRVVTTGRMWIRAFTGTTDAGLAKRRALAAYREYNAAIRAEVPRERLLEYRLGSGWEPLCTFLGKDVPETPFPHRNEASTLESAIGAILLKSFRRSLVNVAVVGGAVVGTVMLARRWLF